MKKNYSLSPINFFLSIGVLLLTFGCTDTSKESNITYFGGKIKNPKGKYVYFSKNGKVLDSAKLDSHNKFSFQLDSIEIGLYTFNHGREYQYLYLEPKDSLLIYLNTWDFDESIIFSGKQAVKNNYLINLFLRQEKFVNGSKHNFRLNEKEFSKIIDAEINKHLTQYNQLIENEENKPSAFFDKLAKIGIYYPLYYLKEYYPFKHRKALRLKKFPTVSKDFYNYRYHLDLNDESLLSYGSYYRYIDTYLYHLAYKAEIDNPKKNNIQLNFMEIVNDKINIESFKNKLLASSVWKSLNNRHISNQEFQKIKNHFFTYCTNEEMISDIKESIKQKDQFKRGSKLPEVFAFNTHGEKIVINDIANNNNTVIYFWPKDSAEIENLNRKLEHLQIKYPDILFIGIETEKTNKDWGEFIERKDLSTNHQFILSKNSSIHAWLESNIAHTILVNQNGNIQSNNLIFTDKRFDKHLKRLKKQ